MKKFLKTLALVLVLAVTMSVVAVAADADGEKASLSFINGYGGTAAFGDNGESVTVTVNSGAFKEDDGYYLVLALKGDGSTIDKDSILYIDQIPAADGAVSFKVYPSVMATSTIVITGVDGEGASNGQVKVALIEGKYILGDVDKDKYVTAADAALVLRVVAKIDALDANQSSAADVDGDGSVTAADAAKLLRVVAQIETLN